MIGRITAGQHPSDVLAAVVRQAERWAHRPETAILARLVLRPWAEAHDLSGRWVPAALWRWARTLPYYREPSTSTGELVLGAPLVVLAGGDCDDVAAAQGAMALSLGLPAAVGLITPMGPDGPAHVTCAVGSCWTPDCLTEPWRLVDPQLPEGAAPADLSGIRWRILSSLPSQSRSYQWAQ